MHRKKAGFYFRQEKVSLSLIYFTLFCIILLFIAVLAFDGFAYSYVQDLVERKFSFDENGLTGIHDVDYTQIAEEHPYAAVELVDVFFVYDADLALIYESKGAYPEFKEVGQEAVIDTFMKKRQTDTSFSYEKEQHKVFGYYLSAGNEAYVIQVFLQTTLEQKFINAIIVISYIATLISVTFIYIYVRHEPGSMAMPASVMHARQRDFLANASHEMKTPLTVIQTNIDVLKMMPDKTAAENMKWIENIESESIALRNLVEDMLMLVSSEVEGVEYDIEQIHLTKLVENICTRQAVMTKVRGVELTYVPSEDIVAYVDRNKFEQMLKIFIDNASKYAKEEGGNIWVRLRKDGENVVIEIKDDGIGMDKEQVMYIFDRFYRADSARQRTSGSVGLGLSIAQEIIRNHNGTIKVESVPDVGTKFIIKLKKMLIS